MVQERKPGHGNYLVIIANIQVLLLTVGIFSCQFYFRLSWSLQFSQTNFIMCQSFPAVLLNIRHTRLSQQHPTGVWLRIRHDYLISSTIIILSISIGDWLQQQPHCVCIQHNHGSVHVSRVCARLQTRASLITRVPARTTQHYSQQQQYSVRNLGRDSSGRWDIEQR